MSLEINKHLILVLLTLIAISTPFIIKVSLSSSTTIVYIDPEKIELLVGKTFTIEIKISNAEKIYGWEFRLKWNSNLLNMIEVVEGDFLKKRSGTFFTTNTSKAKDGLLIVDCTLLGNVPGIDGNGTLATIKFYAKVQGKCFLELEKTILVDESERPVSHMTINGEVTVKPFSFIDWLKSNIPTISIIAAILVIVITSLWFTKFKWLKVKPSSISQFGILDDEEKIIRLLKSAGGRLLQSNIAKQLKFSKSKTSNLLKMMEVEGKIRRERKGRDKIVILIKERDN